MGLDQQASEGAWARAEPPGQDKGLAQDASEAMQATGYKAIVSVQSVAPKLSTRGQSLAIRRNAHLVGQLWFENRTFERRR